MTRRITLAVAAALAALLLATGLAAAQEPPETATATRLEPGLNLVGWVGEPTPASQLFQQIPQLEAIWAWDAELRDWIVAAPGAPEWLGGLGRVTAGMGLRMQLGGDQPFLWERSTEPTRGLVKLRTGWNLVAWSGADGAAIGDVVKGIGWSLRTVRHWDAATQQWITWTSPERSAQVIANTGADQEAGDNAEMPGIRRGEALWIEVARAVNWLQPTEILPRLVFPGGASQELQTRVREDLQAVLSFYRDQYGIQAEPDFTVYAAKDVDELIQAWKDDGEDVDNTRVASTRALWNRAGGWADSNVLVKQASWPEDLSTKEIAWARYTITHEYFHILQGQLSDGGASQWLVEGTANWVESEHAVFDGQQPRSSLHKVRSSQITDDTPTLRSTESDNDAWEYTLGWLATDRLTTDGGPDSAIEFWRQLAPTEIGPHGRWTSTLDWRAALHRVSGQTASEFYEAFDTWQREQAAANAASPNSYKYEGGLMPPGSYEQDGNIILDSYEYDGSWIRGQVTNEHGAPVASTFVNAIRVEGETSVGWNQRAETGDDGAFAVRAPEDGDYRLSVNINDDCTRYYSDGELINVWSGAQPIAVTGTDVHEIDFQLPPNVCGWQVRGRVVGTNAEPLAGMSIRHCDIAMNRCFLPHSTALDGSFAIPVTASGSYRLRLDLVDDCSVYYGASQVAIDRDEAMPITIVGGHVHGLLMRVPEGLCLNQIRGRIAQADGQPLADLSVRICSVEQSHCEWERTDTDGTFAIIAPLEGEYRLTLRLSDDGCDVHYRPAGLTLAKDEAYPLSVRGDGVVGIQMLVPTGMCAYQIKGSIAQADGQPLADTRISACLDADGDCLAWASRNTDDDGAFVITVPTEGSYHLSFNLEGCTVYFRAGGFTTTYSERSTVRVEGRSLRMNPRQIPEGMCAYQIKGSITKADGQPLAGTSIRACEERSGKCVWRNTRNDGSFAFTVSEGTYHLGLELERCGISFSASGLTTNWAERSTVRVERRIVQLEPRQIPASMCALRITGRVIDAKGVPVANKNMQICAPGCGPNGPGTAADGRFAIRVAKDGRYHFGIKLRDQPHCWHSFTGRALGSPNNPVRVSGADVTGVVLRLPGTIEELCE